ncbi:MAG TPA: hypothetical protein DIT97_19560, partial [Gimesia maris]|nr:hypothetical protein [Gimesia maris]
MHLFFPGRWTTIVCFIGISLLQQMAVSAQESNHAAEVKQIFRTRCFECHGNTRREADINILERSSYVGKDGAVVPGKVDESVLYDYIISDDEDSRMPESPLPPLTAG